MKRILLTVFSLFSLTAAFAQTEVAVAFNSGLFSFGGSSAAKTSFIIVGSENNYTNNPYGEKNGFVYGLSANAKHIFANHFLVGLDVGYEAMSSKIDIPVAYTYTSGSSYVKASGETKLTTQFLNLHPNFGFRFGKSKTTLDLTAGMDVGFILKAQEKGEAKIADGTVYATDGDRKNSKTDLRPRIQLTANYQKFGVYAGYSYGLSNYMEGMIGGGPWEANSRVIRFGVSYTIN